MRADGQYRAARRQNISATYSGAQMAPTDSYRVMAKECRKRQVTCRDASARLAAAAGRLGIIARQRGTPGMKVVKLSVLTQF